MRVLLTGKRHPVQVHPVVRALVGVALFVIAVVPVEGRVTFVFAHLGERHATDEFFRKVLGDLSKSGCTDRTPNTTLVVEVVVSGHCRSNRQTYS